MAIIKFWRWRGKKAYSVSHTKAVYDDNGNLLQDVLDGKADSSHTHSKSDLTDYVVDSAMSSTSTNPVQNKVVKAALNDHTHEKLKSGFNPTGPTGEFSAVAGGYYNEATGIRSAVVGGQGNKATGINTAILGGEKNIASSSYATVIGGTANKAEGSTSTVAGYLNTASGYIAFVAGMGNNGLAHQFKAGHAANDCNKGAYSGTSGDAFIIGNGKCVQDYNDVWEFTPSNAFRVTYAGAVYGKAAYNSTGADYAEMFEWEDGNPDNEDRRGLFAYIIGGKIRLATAADTDRRRMGIISAFPAVVGDNFDEDWHGKYLTDIYGMPLTQNVHHEAVYDDESEECIVEECDTEELIINPDYDPDMEYVPRTQRKEYAYWSFIGKLVVRDDGTCEADGYCYPGKDGVATACTDTEKGYYVMERLDDSHIRVLVR